MLNSRSGNKRLDRRIILDRSIKIVFSFSVFIALGILTILLSSIIIQSIGWLDWQFLTSNLSINAQRAGIKGVITGTLLMMVILAPVTLILGVATAIFLEEYVRKGWFHSIVKINISNLSAVPSVIFGLLGLTIFSRLLGLGSSILAG
ncbi:MAG: phosphate ABC transporter, permease protein PstA, partial [Eubacteriales bacterium]|nr:phosphate ABC transporter, permease protein PstA [Eubacteriales bacterium]